MVWSTSGSLSGCSNDEGIEIYDVERGRFLGMAQAADRGLQGQYAFISDR